MLEQKRKMVEDVLLSDAQMKITQALIEQGMDPESPEFQQEVSPEKLKTLKKQTKIKWQILN